MSNMFLNGYNDGIKKLRLNIYIGKTKTILCQLEFNNIPNKDFQKEKNGRPVICNGISIGFFSEIKVSYRRQFCQCENFDTKFKYV